MKYIITKYIICGDVVSNSEPMDYAQAVEVYNVMTKQARRGLREFPELLDENGNVIAYADYVDVE